METPRAAQDAAMDMAQDAQHPTRGGRMLRFSMALLALCAATTGARAQDADSAGTRGFFAGIGVGSSEPTYFADYDFWYYGDVESGDSTTSTLVSGGYRFNRYFALEAAYLDAGGMGFDQALVYVPELLDVYNTRADIDVSAGELSAVGIFPFGRIWEVYLRAGLAYSDGTSTQRLTPSYGGPAVERTVDDSGTGLLFGFGVGVTVLDRVHVRLEYQFFDVEEELLAAAGDESSTIDTFLLDVQYRFGDGW